jgi:Flp pilus assembly protein TadG
MLTDIHRGGHLNPGPEEDCVRDRRTRTRRAGRRKGAQLIEFTLVLIPLLSMVFVLLDTAWAIYAKATLQRAVREGVRTGITLTSSQMANGACLTDTVKSLVQTQAMGLLNGATGLAYIKVTYYLPPSPTSASGVTDVSGNSNGDAGGNIMQVSVQNYSLSALLPRIFGTKTGNVDDSPFIFSVWSADMIEPTSAPPCIGTAP